MRPETWQYEVETGRRVAQETGLLASHGSIPLRLVNAQAYTRELAIRLNGRGWGLVYKSIGLSIDMLAIDAIVNRDTGDVVTVIDGLGTDNQRPMWSCRCAAAQRNYVDPMTPDAMRLVLSRAEVNMLKLTADVGELLRLARLYMPLRGSTNGHPESARPANS